MDMLLWEMSSDKLCAHTVNLIVKELRYIKVIESKVNVKVIFFLCGNFFLILVFCRMLSLS